MEEKKVIINELANRVGKRCSLEKEIETCHLGPCGIFVPHITYLASLQIFGWTQVWQVK